MTQLRSAPLSPSASEVRQWVLDHVWRMQRLRDELLLELLRHRLITSERFDDRADRVLLVVTELASNALLHGLPPSIVRLLVDDDCFVLDIADHDLETIPQLRDIDPLGSGGRGLYLARQMALDVGWYATATAKHIWASFPHTSPGRNAM
ncbi:hypothetical protein GCM10017581_010230 [Dactylosporangium matsuzakiense]|uniref:Histidine kinase/HSP90-like ATPase domain-containing protein n=1 Tax=Dactylosporangium matsuzakiense TaxID=53360 RepID=A0A9W6KDI7_9ACTN|nr:hypothetical protein GCM10017581_010230 [Dactylosporangium matsuzakiense]